MTAYYNEIDPFAAAWLRELIKAGEIAPGDVDERDIRDVRPDDLAGYAHCHFFAGIGGWSYALRLAGWPDDRPVWTGSCPCQPFSAAGARGGVADERHLWPHWHHLIAQCRPAIIFGEQVASKDGLGWFDLVSADLEGSGYAWGAADLCAAGLGAPHIRQRLYFAAIDEGRMAHADGRDTGSEGLQRGRQHGRLAQDGPAVPSPILPGADPLHGFWRGADWIVCSDSIFRPIEPSLEPLADGIPSRMGRLRGYGNAIVPQVAAAFIAAFDGALGDVRAAA
jgi:DNA (cytosine-5)-methyltransferase 1